MWIRRAVGASLAAAFTAAAAGGGWLWWSHGAFERAMRRVLAAGFVERAATVDGARVHYAEGPNNGPSLLLIHGQGGDWKSYASVLPTLAEDFHVYAVDCFGHGNSAHDPRLYSAVAHGRSLEYFMQVVLTEPAVVSGHSSGGVLAAWLGANAGDRVSAVLLEDPPLFATQLPRAQATWNYVDLARTCHAFLDSGRRDWVRYAWQHQRMWRFFGNSAHVFINAGLRYHDRHPDKPIRVWFVPQFSQLTRTLDAYDPRFGDAFYTGAWDSGLDLEETLRAIQVPATLIHTKVAHDEEGILMAAMGGAEAARARALIGDVEFVKVETGHDFHNEDPKTFVALARHLAQRAQADQG